MLNPFEILKRFFALCILGFCADTTLATDPAPDPLLIDAIPIGDLDGDGLSDILYSNLTHSSPELDIFLTYSGVSSRIVVLGDNETIIWENCHIVDELGWEGSRGILINTELGTSEGGVVTICRVIDSVNLQLLGQAVGLQGPEDIAPVWLAQWQGDSVPDGVIDLIDFSDALSEAPYYTFEENIQHRALIGATDINLDGILDADDFIALTLNFELTEQLSAHAGAVQSWRIGLLTWIAEWWWNCADCCRDCNDLMHELQDYKEDYNTWWTENCAPYEQEEDPISIPEYLQCLHDREAYWAHAHDIARRASGNCMCIYHCHLPVE